MRVTVTPCATLALLASINGAATLHAQAAEPQSIPTSLAKSVIGEFGSMMGGLHFVVGRTPTGWPSELTLPAPAKLVGGGTLGPVRTTVYEFPSASDWVSVIDAQLRRLGFAHAESPLSGMRQGFVADGQSGPAHAYCGTLGAVVVMQLDSTTTTRTISVVFNPDREGSGMCSSRPMAARPFQMPLTLPDLHPPRGVMARMAGTNASSGSMETSIRLDTTLTADSIATHYAAQLTAAGWQVARSSLAGDGVALRQVSMHDDKGDEWHGVILVLTSMSQREVTLRMVKDRSQF